MATALTFIPSATAHEETALYALSVIDRVSPESSGVSFRVMQLTQPVLVASNRTDRPLLILGSHGEPFLRLSEGRVDTNLNSPLSYESRDPSGHAQAPPDLDVGAEPRWQTLERGSSWSWFDPRIRFEPGRDAWQVEARSGAQAIEITGSFEPLDGHGHFLTALEDPPVVPRLEIELLDGAIPALFVRNETGDELRVPGRQGEPFLRIGPKGVLGNLRSPDYYLGGSQTVRPVPRSADPNAPARWKRLSRVPIWTWLEFRARLPVRLTQRSLLGPTRRTVLRWTTPMDLGGRDLELKGLLEWVPPENVSHGSDEESGLGPTFWLTVSGAAALVVVAAFWSLRRR